MSNSTFIQEYYEEKLFPLFKLKLGENRQVFLQTISSEADDGLVPIAVDGKPVVLPTAAEFEAADWDAWQNSDRVPFHPLCEDHTQQYSEISKRLVRATTYFNNCAAMSIATRLAQVALDKKLQPKLRPAMKGYLSNIKKINPDTLKLLEKIIRHSDMTTSGTCINVSCRSNVEYEGRTAKRLVTLGSDILERIEDDLGITDKKCRVTRKMDKEVFTAIFQFLFPFIGDEVEGSFPSFGKEAPLLDALIKMRVKLARRMNDILEGMAGLIDEDHLAQMHTDIVKGVQAAPELTKICGKLPYNTGTPLPNESQVKPEPAKIEAEPEPAKIATKPVSLPPKSTPITKTEPAKIAASKETKMSNSNYSEYLEALMAQRAPQQPQQPQYQGQAPQNHEAPIWVQDSNYPAGGYYCAPHDLARTPAPQPNSRPAPPNHAPQQPTEYPPIDTGHTNQDGSPFIVYPEDSDYQQWYQELIRQQPNMAAQRPQPNSRPAPPNHAPRSQHGGRPTYESMRREQSGYGAYGAYGQPQQQNQPQWEYDPVRCLRFYLDANGFRIYE